ncbi:hypothetical protein RHS04_01450 [Rhizoctonia solani]|uniref:Serine/threonine specific protein phosphatases domain-containing protein n=1 Tax=Rhizoctonia solani TaxID=456999 RepID=A0A8H7HEE3_9AGAM|nr:hypothetical protein RHS04_01450 [Rhizoctonia solani]
MRAEIPHEGAMADLVWSDPDSEKEDFAISPRYVDESDGPGSLSTARFSFSDSALDDRLAAIAPVQRRLAGGAGYTFGSGVVRKFLETNNMHHILRAHQLCMEGFTVLFDNRLSTVWSAPNYCYRCGNSASILEVGPGETMHFNVFEAAPENQTDGPSQQVVGGAAKWSCYYAIMAPPLSPELRWLVVYWYIELEWNADECAQISQHEIQLALYTHREVDVSLSTISRALVAAAYSRKSISREALEQNEALQAAWQAQWGIYDASAFLWVDECGIDDQSSQRLFGYAPIGHHCVERSFFYHGVKYSALPVLGVEGILGISIFEGAVTKERFLHFLRTQVAPLLNPFSPKGVSRCILVCDNCAIHHDEEICQLVEDECALMLGAKLCYLPPYSPDFNPIEEAFSKAKSWLRRHNTQLIEPAQRPWLIHQAMLSITPDNALGWIENCGYSI